MGRRFRYWLLGFVIASICLAVLLVLRGKPVHYWTWVLLGVFVFGFNSGFVTLWIAERRGKVKPKTDRHKPLTLFAP
jgi:hypothetical protein